MHELLGHSKISCRIIMRQITKLALAIYSDNFQDVEFQTGIGPVTVCRKSRSRFYLFIKKFCLLINYCLDVKENVAAKIEENRVC